MNIRAYRTAAVIHARQVSRYRGAALGGMVTQVFFGAVLVALYRALAGEGALFRETASYVWLQQIFFRAFFSSDGDINEQVMTGGVCYSLLRPVNLHLWCVCRELAGKVTGVAMRLLPMLLIQLLLPEDWRLLPPDGAAGLIQFAVSLVTGFVLMAEVNMICAAVTMRTLDNKGITGLINLTMMILCGNIIPLTLAPARLYAVLRWQPFAQMLDAPIRMYLHALPPAEWAAAFGVQCGWLLLILLFSRALWAHNIRRLELQGG